MSSHSIIHNTRWLVSALLTFILQGCSTAPTSLPTLSSDTPLNWQATIAQISSLDDWEFSGKIGIKIPDRIDSAAINRWSQQGDQFTIDLSSVLFGLGSTQIKGSPYQITITESGEDPITSYQPEQLIQQHIGWPLPITQLRFWIKGIPAPIARNTDQIKEQQFNDKGQLSLLKQSDWQIRFYKYKQTDTPNSPLATRIDLPGKIVLQQHQVKITVIVNEWLLP